MRLISIANCIPGMEAAKPIYTDTGAILVGVGVALTERMIKALKERHISHLYIRDKATEDLEIIDSVPLELRIEAIAIIQDTFKQMPNKLSKIVDQKNVYRLQKVFKDLMTELGRNNNMMNLLTSVVVHDYYIFSHSFNVTIYTLTMALKLGLDEKQINELAIGGVFHDIGKWEIPLAILNKEGKLTNEEYDLIKKHTELGFELLRKQPDIPLLAAHCAYQHHEKLDGTGYPRGLKENEIHPFAKIMAVADVFDALTSNRSYRNAMLPHEAMEVLFSGANTHFDTGILSTFRQSVAYYPIGVTVKLNTGESAVVVKYLFHAPGRPIVRVVKDACRKDLIKPYELDLSKNLSLMITECDAIM